MTECGRVDKKLSEIKGPFPPLTTYTQNVGGRQKWGGGGGTENPNVAECGNTVPECGQAELSKLTSKAECGGGIENEKKLKPGLDRVKNTASGKFFSKISALVNKFEDKSENFSWGKKK